MTPVCSFSCFNLYFCGVGLIHNNSKSGHFEMMCIDWTLHMLSFDSPLMTVFHTEFLLGELYISDNGKNEVSTTTLKIIADFYQQPFTHIRIFNSNF
jgi:hypothetical protein